LISTGTGQRNIDHEGSVWVTLSLVVERGDREACFFCEILEPMQWIFGMLRVKSKAFGYFFFFLFKDLSANFQLIDIAGELFSILSDLA
jgi:hypothetical protein